MIELLKIEHECMLRGSHDDCDRNCADCDLVQNDDELHEMYTDVIALLKEQEPKTGHWIFESQYCEAWSHTCSECGKRMTTAVNTFANWCWNCGAKMTTGGERG